MPTQPLVHNSFIVFLSLSPVSSTPLIILYLQQLGRKGSNKQDEACKEPYSYS